MTAYNFIQNELRLMEMQLSVSALPPDFKLSDVFLDGQQVMQELNIKERTLQHYRTTGKISYSDSLGKIFYFKHEIARLLLEGRRNFKNGVKRK
ncbi:helix-turn-helix domain-containing protein [Ginsengibacter hankyongi]|uniref:Helix-turn-helix domain-containing protein n=1 Tax=Ginsengibacter hankyongi TaxID=2607284 RepID=A0A5J5IK03_9BACT|nr:helix-turn-helix domain-containing protein [Ginsengibacter hankyongi]KAA9038725.1 helix-turn-helix domain-containing protein [Ginsengibacter hankyongi]